MTSQFEIEVNTALEEFLAKVTRAAERASIELIHAIFGRIAVPRQRPPAPAEAHAPAMPPPLSRNRASLDEVRARVLARIGEAPGSTASQLGAALGLHSDTIRRHVRRLASHGVIRSEEHSRGPGALRQRVFFPAEPAQRNEQDHLTSHRPLPDPPTFTAGELA
jgi:DNA-binding transcriptional ArsR family regulator